MLTATHHGPVVRIALEGSLLGRPTYAVSAYYFDGTLVDTGMPSTGPALAGWLADRPLERVLLSHHHEDHIGGAPYLLPRGAPIYAPADGQAMISHPRRIPLYRRLAFGQPRGVETEPLAKSVPLGRLTARVISTPGHAPDHVVFLVPETGWLFGADLFVEPRGKYLRRRDNLQQWYDSIRTTLTYDFGELFCAHAGYVADGRAALRAKLAFWEEMAGQARALQQRGLSERAIREALLGRERFLTYWSLGSYSKLTLVRALLALNAVPGQRLVSAAAS